MGEPKMMLGNNCYRLKAKVEHTCECCGKTVPKNQEYIKQDIYTDGYYEYSNDFCLDCGTEIAHYKSFNDARKNSQKT